MTERDSPTEPSDEAPKPEGDASPPGQDASAPSAPEPAAPMASTEAGEAGSAGGARLWSPNYVFLAVVSIISLALDLGTKWWAKTRLDDAYVGRRIDIVKDTFAFIFRRNNGGAWGLLQDEPESIRRPFFLGISVVAIVFIVSLYRKLTPQQWALKWGLPLVLGGALGNLVNRVQYNYVVDFIDVSARWDHSVHHWPTFNVADIAIVVGVGLMAIDMFTPRRSPRPAGAAVAATEGPAGPPIEMGAAPGPGGVEARSGPHAPAAAPKPPIAPSDPLAETVHTARPHGEDATSEPASKET